MNRRVDIDLQVQWPPARASEKWSMAEEAVEQDDRQESKHTDNVGEVDISTHDDLKTYVSNELFDGAKEVGIKHAGFVYRLKITRQGKLILNK